MIGRLTGRLVECKPGEVLLDVGGVGYGLQIPLSTYWALSGGDGAAPVVLHVHTYVREDALQLYGFATASERDAFSRLISVSGIGPRTALAVLSGIGVQEMESAVLEDDRARLERIPGIGRKTAERVILELRDKIDPSRGRRTRSAGGRPHSADSREGESAVRDDAVSALVHLGYRRDAAEKAVEASMAGTDESSTTLETVLRNALRGLVR